MISKPICQFTLFPSRNITEASLHLSNSKKSSALVGYAGIDGDASWIVPLADYLSCGTASTSIDIFGLND